MAELQKFRADELLYQIGKIIWLPFCCLGVWFSNTGYERYGEFIVCAIRRMCGLPCPGCGGTRAFYYFFKGDFIRSLQLNPIVIFGIFAYLHFMSLYFYRKHIRKNIIEGEIHIQYYMYVAILIILVQWMIKVIGIFCFT